ncbi:40S ribosomal protein S6 [Mycena crocata]|nr:40S ribosomal protein S6 [Mycena crocata]
MKINIANPATGQQKLIDIDDERRYRIFYDKKIVQEAPPTPWARSGLASLVSSSPTVSSFCSPTATPATTPRRTGERKRKSVRGCIVGPDIAVLSVVLVKQGEGEIAGLTDNVLPKRLGPKRATKIKRFFNLSKEDEVRKYVVRREVTPKKEGGKPYTKAPKIQRLVTPMRLQRRRHLKSLIRRRTEHQKEQKAEFDVLIAKRVAEKKAKVATIKAAHHK